MLRDAAWTARVISKSSFVWPVVPSRDFSSSTVAYRVWSIRVTVHVPSATSESTTPVPVHLNVHTPSTVAEQDTSSWKIPALTLVMSAGAAPRQVFKVASPAGALQEHA